MSSSLTQVSPTICLIGAGNMGGALLGGWLANGFDPKLIEVVDPSTTEAMQKTMMDYGVRHFVSAELASKPDIIIVAVKPQIMGAVLPTLMSLVDGENVLVSVAAGATMENLAAPFDNAIRVVRTIPNTPALVGCGMTVCVANERVNEPQRQTVTSLLQSIGEVAWVDDEALIDVATAVSGSGPAYVFHLAEAMAQAGVTQGLPVELAAQIASATVSGAGELIRQSDDAPAILRQNVTSPNGTTAAALEVLMGENGFPDLLRTAVEAATKRSRELAG